jgi:hypothetical protein
MTPAKPLVACALALAASTASAQSIVYRCVDENGRPQYTNVRGDLDGRKCTVVHREVTVVPASGAPVASASTAANPPARPAPGPAVASANVNPGPAGFPRVDQQTQRSRDDSRRKILEDELSNERRSLERARAEMVAEDAQRGPRTAERLKPMQDAVDRHERNIAALQREISNTR